MGGVEIAFTAAGSIVFALEKLGVKRIGFTSPYLPDVAKESVNFLEDAGFEVMKRADVLGRELNNADMGKMKPDEVALNHNIKAYSVSLHATLLFSSSQKYSRLC